jgi:predicted CopG family antitoxin
MTIQKPSDLNRKNVSVRLDTYERLKSYGGISDAYSDVIDAIMNFAESKGMTRDSLEKFRDSTH